MVNGRDGVDQFEYSPTEGMMTHRTVWPLLFLLSHGRLKLNLPSIRDQVQSKLWQTADLVISSATSLRNIVSSQSITWHGTWFQKIGIL